MFGFGRGKNKDADGVVQRAGLEGSALGDSATGDRKVEQETLQRWRDLSESRAGQDFDSGPPQASWEDGAGEFVRVIKKGTDASIDDSTEVLPSVESPMPGPDASWSSGTPTPTTAESTAVKPSTFAAQAVVAASNSVAPVSAPSVTKIGNGPLIPDALRSKTEASGSGKSTPAESDLERRFGANIRTALGPGTVIEGKFSFETPVRIDGSLSGEVLSTSALIVGEQATVEANIRVGSLIVFGEVRGHVEADELVEVKGGGKLTANIKTANVVVDAGGFFEGGCNIA